MIRVSKPVLLGLIALPVLLMGRKAKARPSASGGAGKGVSDKGAVEWVTLPDGTVMIRLDDGRLVYPPFAYQGEGAPPPEIPPFSPPPPPPPKPKPKLTSQQQEIVDETTAFVKEKFGGDWKKAFDAYAGNDGLIGKDELSDMFSDGGIGPYGARDIAAARVIEFIDGDGDGKISWEEFGAKLGI